MSSALPSSMSLQEDIILAFDSCGVSCELLDDWALRETKALKVGLSLGNVSAESSSERSTTPSLQPLALQQRWAALGLTRQLISLLGLPNNVWFDAALLLDLSLARQSWNVSMQELPTTCVGVVSILSKSLGGASRKRFSDLAATLSSLVGHVVTPEEIADREMHLIDGLQWQVNLPSMAHWASAFCARFHVLSRGAFTASIEWILQWCLGNAEQLIERVPTSFALAPRCMANGFFLLGLVAAQFAPFEAFHLDDTINSEWAAMFPQCEPQTGLPSSGLPPAYWEQLPVLLQIITRSDMATLRQDAREVTIAIRAVGAFSQRAHAAI